MTEDKNMEPEAPVEDIFDPEMEEEPVSRRSPMSVWVRIGLGLIALVVVVVLAGPSQFGLSGWGDLLPGADQPTKSDGNQEQAEPTPSGGQYDQAIDNYQSGNFDQAWSQFRTDVNYAAALEVWPDIAEAEQAVQGAPSSRESHFRLGTAWARAGLQAPAEAAFKQAVALDDQYVDAYVNLGVVYYQMNRLDDALVQYDTALTINPNDADVHHNRGAVYVQQALLSAPPDGVLLEKGVAEWNQALELNPDLFQAYFSLGVVADLKGQKEEALAYFQKFAELDDGSDPQATSAAQAFLEKLQQ